MSRIYVTAQQIQEIDRVAIQEFGIPSLLLMENAGKGVSEVVLTMLKKKKNAKVAILCGKGNNGGDGLVAARHLNNKKIDIAVYLLAKQDEFKNGPLINLKALKKITHSIQTICDIESFNRIKEDLKSNNVIIDAIFGTGLISLIREPYATIIKYINKLNIPIVSVDIPSGLDATEGKIFAAAVRADKTVTLCLPKKGFLKNSGPSCIGEVIVCDIGIPSLAIDRVLG